MSADGCAGEAAAEMTTADRAAPDALAQILAEFSRICEIPHPSMAEQPLSHYLLSRLLAHTDHVRQDRFGNLMAFIPPKNATADAPVVILQAHMDMVVAGNVIPEQAKIVAKQNDDWLCSDGRTSLGADNGIGLAVILYLLEREDIVHGPLQILFTVCEEQGLKGARSIPAAFLRNARYLINLDGFHADTALTGCKSGLRETLWRNTGRLALPSDMSAYRLEIGGFQGGHSGEDIGLGRCNAIRMLAALLLDLQACSAGIAVSSFWGGTGFNVIPACCSAEVVVKKEKAAAFVATLLEAFRLRCAVYNTSDSEGTLKATEIPCPSECWSPSAQQDILRALTSLADGVMEKGGNAVSASCNLGRVYEVDGRFYIEDMLRCDTSQQEQTILEQHTTVASAYGFHYHAAGYHSWNQAGSNLLAEAAARVYQKQTGTSIQLKKAQVGVEPAFFQEKAPHLQMICLGADIVDAHSVKERVNCQSILRLSNLLDGILYEIARMKNKN